MLDQLLRNLAHGGVGSCTDLTRVLDIGEELLHQMIDDLVRMGYLKAVEDDCQVDCQECPEAGVCAICGRARVWSLTKNGERIAQKLQ